VPEPFEAASSVLSLSNRTSSATVSVAPPGVELTTLWSAICDHLRSSLGGEAFDTWMRDVSPVETAGDELVLAVRDEYSREWLERRLGSAMETALRVEGRSDLRPRYVVSGLQRSSGAGTSHREPERTTAGTEGPPALSPDYTFEEFVVGESNHLAHATCMACLEMPGRLYNPLVLVGGVGVGKTHLLQAIGNMAAKAGSIRVLYATSESFTNELVSAIRGGNTRAFRERYRDVDFFLLDDIQFIAGKDATQEEFFHTFNTLHQAGKQIVLSSDQPTSEVPVLEERLRSRFSWGLSVEVRPPDSQTRQGIVARKAARRGLELSPEVVRFIASAGGHNVREIEGSLNRLLAFSQLLKANPTLDVARHALGAGPSPWKPSSASEVVNAVAEHYGVKQADLVGPRREHSIAEARQVAMYLMREEAKLSLADIGMCLGGRNHTTVIYGHAKIAAALRRGGRVRDDVESLLARLRRAGQMTIRPQRNPPI
jgi:chromosomal replication initiator protein